MSYASIAQEVDSQVWCIATLVTSGVAKGEVLAGHVPSQSCHVVNARAALFMPRSWLTVFVCVVLICKTTRRVGMKRSLLDYFGPSKRSKCDLALTPLRRFR